VEQNAFYAQSGHCYWTSRLIEAERQYVRSANPDLMKVYAELIRHYQRMAKLHQAGSQIPNPVRPLADQI
jgi:hypothetical protein